MTDTLTLLLMWGATALGFFLVVEGVSYLFANSGGKGASRIERRLAPKTQDSTDRLSPAAISAREDNPTLFQRLDEYIDRAGLTIKGPYLIAMAVVLSVALYWVYTMVVPFLPVLVQALLGVISGCTLPVLYLRMAYNKRSQKFQEQFPDALDLIVRGLRIGHPISAALENIAEEMTEPISHEFAIVTHEVTYGKNVPDAIQSLLKRMDISDVRFFVVAVQIHHESGGNLAEILAGLSVIIRNRFHLHRKVRALSVEGRFSAWFLSAFPVVMIFAMNLLQPGYYEKVADTEYFDVAVGVTFTLLVLNVIAMRMMTKLEV